jgi:hypothetical protein
LALLLEPIYNVANDNDTSGNHGTCSGGRANEDKHCATFVTPATAYGCNLNRLKFHVFGHDLAVRVEDLRGYRHNHAALQ